MSPGRVRPARADLAAPTTSRTALRCEDGRAAPPRPDTVVVEEPLEIRVAGEPVTVTMRTPGEETFLALGFLLAEGVIRSRGDVAELRAVESGGRCNVVEVQLAPGRRAELGRLSRHVFASSSCGLCGRLTIDAIRRRIDPVAAGPAVAASTLARLPGLLRRRQEVFAATGGLHAAGLFDAEGDCLEVCEDVGRHNAVDKVIGRAVARGTIPLSRHVLLVSGRVSFEIVQKALAAGIPFIAAVSAPSSLAIDLAEESNQTLVAFLREGRFGAYTHAERIRFGA